MSDLATALEDGVAESTWRRRTRREGWAAPYPGVRIAPWAEEGHAPALAACVAAHTGSAVAGAAARWWRDLGREPASRELEVVVPHGRWARKVAPVDPGMDREQRRWLRHCARIHVRRCRWFQPADRELVRGLTLTSPVADAILLAGGSAGVLRAYLIDGRHAGWIDLDQLAERLTTVGPVEGRHVLRAELDALAGRRPESPFHAIVLDELERLGYAPDLAPGRISTPLGRELLPDIPLPRWHVGIELDGDRYHRDREQRRRDRDRLAAYATTTWRPVIVDWRSWHDDRQGVLATVDEAIRCQQRLGIGTEHRLPGLPARTRRAVAPGRTLGSEPSTGRGAVTGWPSPLS